MKFRLLPRLRREEAVTEICLTKLDVLNVFDDITVTTGCDVRENTIFKRMPGWRSNIFFIENYVKLFVECRDYIEYIETELKAPAKYISVGPGRREIIGRET